LTKQPLKRSKILIKRVVSEFKEAPKRHAPL